MNKKSFTLIELLVVIAIIGILSSLVIARFSDWGDNARIANTLQWSAGVHRTLGANLVGHWPLNLDVNDISGYGNNGTMHNFEGEPDDYWVDGVPGTGNQALKFDGVDDYVEMGNDNILNMGNGDFTLGGWIYIGEKIATWQFIFGKKDPAHASAGYGLYYGSHINQLHYIVADGIAANTSNFYTPIRGKWTYVAVIREEADSAKGYAYINGNRVEFGSSISMLNVDTTTVFRVGNNYSGDYKFEGLICDVRVYNTALTAEEVGRIYAESAPRYALSFSEE